jgi:hypothetical protein
VVTDVRQARGHGHELADRGADLIDHVRGVRAEPTAPLRGIAPPRRHLRIGVGEERDMEQERREARLADRAGADRPGEQRLPRSEPELGAEEVHDAGLLGCSEKRARFRRVAREGFLAQHVPARADRLQHERSVRVRWRRDRHRVDTRRSERVGEARARVRDLEALGPRRRLHRITTDQRLHVEPGGTQRTDMGEAPESRSDHGDADAHAGIPAAFATIDSIAY